MVVTGGTFEKRGGVDKGIRGTVQENIRIEITQGQDYDV